MMESKKEKKEKKKKVMPIWLGVLIFVLVFFAGVVSTFAIKPAWQTNYLVTWNDEIGTKLTDISYGTEESNKFDLYLPKDSSKENYGLVVYLHAGGFTSGDKAGDENMLAWLCSKGYVAAGINYTLRTETNNASVLLESNEIKEAIPQVVDAAKKQGYNIDKMAVAGGSAGHTLAMIYAYRDADEAPVPVVLTFGAVGPSSFYVEDWDVYGFDQDTEEARTSAAFLFGVMGGVDITPDEIKEGSYVEKMKEISAAEWVSKNPIPSVVAYGTCDKIQPFKASLRLKKALEENNVDHVYLEMPHSGHGLQNDNKVSKKWMESIDEYLNKYLPVK